MQYDEYMMIIKNLAPAHSLPICYLRHPVASLLYTAVFLVYNVIFLLLLDNFDVPMPIKKRH